MTGVGSVPGVAVGAAVGDALGHTGGHTTFMADWAAANLILPASNAFLAHVSDDMAVWMKNLTCYDHLHIAGTNAGLPVSDGCTLHQGCKGRL